MNITVVSVLQTTLSSGDSSNPVFSTWKYMVIAMIVTLVVILVSVFFGKSVTASKFIEKSLSGGSKSSCPEVNKKSVVYPYYVATIQNARPYQEDRYTVVGSFNGDENTTFYAVFDGHGGSKCSQFCANYLASSIANSINTSPYRDDLTRRSRSGSIRKGDKKRSGFLREMDIVNGFQLCDARYRSAVTKDDGSTVVSVFLNPSARQLITAHEESFDLTSDHKPSNASEKERVELLGGRIIQYGVLRVQGVLAVTRALGDFSLRPYVSNVPAVGFVELTGRECFVVLASDGLWDVLDHGDVAALLQTFVRQGEDMEGCARMLAEEAVRRQSMDNVGQGAW